MGKREQPDSEIIDFNSLTLVFVCCLVEHSCDHGEPWSTMKHQKDWGARKEAWDMEGKSQGSTELGKELR